MNGKPDRIWFRVSGDKFFTASTEEPDRPAVAFIDDVRLPDPTEYIRADLAAADKSRIAELEAENVRLRELVQSAYRSGFVAAYDREHRTTDETSSAAYGSWLYSDERKALEE